MIRDLLICEEYISHLEKFKTDTLSIIATFKGSETAVRYSQQYADVLTAMMNKTTALKMFLTEKVGIKPPAAVKTIDLPSRINITKDWELNIYDAWFVRFYNIWSAYVPKQKLEFVRNLSALLKMTESELNELSNMIRLTLETEKAYLIYLQSYSFFKAPNASKYLNVKEIQQIWAEPKTYYGFVFVVSLAAVLIALARHLDIAVFIWYSIIILALLAIYIELLRYMVGVLVGSYDWYCPQLESRLGIEFKLHRFIKGLMLMMVLGLPMCLFYLVNRSIKKRKRTTVRSRFILVAALIFALASVLGILATPNPLLDEAAIAADVSIFLSL